MSRSSDTSSRWLVVLVCVLGVVAGATLAMWQRAEGQGSDAATALALEVSRRAAVEQDRDGKASELVQQAHRIQVLEADRDRCEESIRQAATVAERAAEVSRQSFDQERELRSRCEIERDAARGAAAAAEAEVEASRLRNHTSEGDRERDLARRDELIASLEVAVERERQTNASLARAIESAKADAVAAAQTHEREGSRANSARQAAVVQAREADALAARLRRELAAAQGEFRRVTTNGRITLRNTGERSVLNYAGVGYMDESGNFRFRKASDGGLLHSGAELDLGSGIFAFVLLEERGLLGGTTGAWKFFYESFSGGGGHAFVVAPDW